MKPFDILNFKFLCLFRISDFGFGIPPRRASAARGMTLIEALIGSALVLVVFVGIFGVYQMAIDLVFSTKAATGATALINEQMEYLRGLSYDTIGTISGIPSGTIPQIEERMLNGIPYTLSTLVQHVDDPADGLEALDENGITADYKLIRVGADWTIRSKPRSTFAITRIAPHGIESLTSGGTLRVNVFDIVAAPVAGAAVHIVNTDLDPGVDVSITTGSSGSVAFPGAPPGAGYQVTVTKDEYSSAQTYDVTVENPNPNPGHVSVVNQTTTTVSLEINELGSLLVSTFSPVGPGTFDDTFDDQLSLSATTSVTTLGSALVLEGESGSYAASGSATSVSVSPAYLTGWSSLTWSANTPTDTSAFVYMYYWNGAVYTLVPDTDIPGNSAGFSSGFVDLSALPVGTYGTLRVMAVLASSDPMVTPQITEWSVGYTAGPTPLPNVDFDIHGARTIGTTGGGAPIYKTDESHTTTAYGTWLIEPIEADAYTLSMSASSLYAIAEMCENALSVTPGEDASVSLTLEDASAHSLRVAVSGSGSAISGATATLEGGVVNESKNTSACGQTYFGDIPSGTYTLTVSAPGFQTTIDNNVNVANATVLGVTLSP